MQMMKIEDLRPHKRNSEFFDDMTGEKWQEFLDSIKTSGVIEPIVVTQDKVIVSGHQRVRACKELGIKEILAEVRVYEDEDKIIKDLLETNIRQRGDIGGSSIKLGRRIKELERIYGIREGSAGGNGGANQFAGSANGASSKMTEKELAEKLGIGLDTLKRAKSLTNLSPEIQQLIEQGNISASTAARVIGSKLSKEEQTKFVAMINGDKKYTQKEMDDEIRKWKVKVSEVVQEKDSIARQKVKTVTERVEVEVDKPETREYIQKLENRLKEKSESNRILAEDNAEKSKMLSEAIGISTNYQLVSHCTENIKEIRTHIEGLSKYLFMADTFNEIPIATRMEYVRQFKALDKLVHNALTTIQTKENEFITTDYVEV